MEKGNTIFLANMTTNENEHSCILCGKTYAKIDMKQVRLVAKEDGAIIINQLAYVCKACYWQMRDEEQS